MAIYPYFAYSKFSSLNFMQNTVKCHGKNEGEKIENEERNIGEMPVFGL